MEMDILMTGAIAVADYREYESWRRARFIVCSVFDLTRSSSRRVEYKRFVQEIDRLSVSILDNLARGFEGNGHPGFINKACSAIDRLDQRLGLAQQKQLMTASDILRLRKELDSVRRLVGGQSK